jgi:hypothetical protein
MSGSDTTHVMVDIETLGKTPGHAILSIGAVIFDSDGIHSEFGEKIDLESCVDRGMDIDDDTIDWLENQDASFTVDGKPLPEVLQKFSSWLPNGKYKVWAKSPSFDCKFLRDAYSRCDLDVPWSFWEQRDVRTAEEFFSYVTEEKSPNPGIPGEPHDPVYDAKEQALSVLMARRKVMD